MIGGHDRERSDVVHRRRNRATVKTAEEVSDRLADRKSRPNSILADVKQLEAGEGSMEALIEDRFYVHAL
jgi:hypothetical protein